MSGVEACLREAFRLGVFVGDDLEGTVGAILGAGRGLSSEDSENTGVPCLKEVFSVSLSEEGSKEESISSTTTGEDCLTGRDVDWKAIRANFLVGLVVGLVGERICGLDLTVVSVFGGSVALSLIHI